MHSIMIIFAMLFASTLANEYNFQYSIPDEGRHSRVESGNGKTVKGSYSYVDANGHSRTVNYEANEHGFHPSGDISVDFETARAAEALAQQAPRLPAEYATVNNFAAPVPHTQFTGYSNFAFSGPQKQISTFNTASQLPVVNLQAPVSSPQYTFSSQVDHASSAQQTFAAPAAVSSAHANTFGNVITSSVDHSAAAPAFIQAIPITTSNSAATFNQGRRYRSPVSLKQKKRV